MSYPSFYNSISNSFFELRSRLIEGVKSRKSGFRTMNLSYINADMPYCRTVVLRKCDENLQYLQCHSDYRSFKINAMMQNPNVALHLYDPVAKIQLSINGIAQIHYQNELAQEAWDKTQILSRRCYLTQNAPSQQIESATAGFDPKFLNNTQTITDTQNGYDNFCVIRVLISQIDWLYLHKHGNQRILFTPHMIQSSDKIEYKGVWLAP